MSQNIDLDEDLSVFENLIISNNTANYNGGGLFIYLSNSLITNTIISDNIAGNSGGGIDMILSSPSLFNVNIFNNHLIKSIFCTGIAAIKKNLFLEFIG